jgi:multisubunit Na+/H+ antiporter MnhB subunit
MMRQIVALIFVFSLAAILILVAASIPFGEFPKREIGGFRGESVGQRILDEAPQTTGAANVVTSVVWDYRGYDTVGEVTVLFTAVCGVVTVFRALRRKQ